MAFNTPNKKFTSKMAIPASPFLKKIGFGTGVAVYEFTRSPLSNTVRSPWALKKVTKRNVNKLVEKRLVEEANILRQLDHLNIVGFRAFGKAPDGSSVLAMEECNNCLGDMIENRSESQQGPFSAENILKMCLDISSALNYLHNTALLLHCDVKSYNILIKGEFDICKLCDFGVCLPLKKNGEVDEEKTGPEPEFVGTPAWSAPEILQFPQVITTKADVYAFGLVIWEMIALSPPVDETFQESFDDSFKSEETRKRPNLPDVDLGEEYQFVLEIFFHCTVEDLANRPTAEILQHISAEMILEKEKVQVDEEIIEINE